MKNKILGYYNYTVVLTYVGVLIGFIGVLCGVRGEIGSSLICLMLAGICDMFDGAIAATKERTADEKSFGIQIDSLSDLICFGVLPAVIVFQTSSGNGYVSEVTGLYVLCALIRLAYFNVDEQNRQKESDGRRKYYYGLPVTTAALILPVSFAIEQAADMVPGTITFYAMMVMGILFLAPFRIRKPELIGKIMSAICCGMEFALAGHHKENRCHKSVE